MTIRQFLYLAAGVLLAYVFWQLDLPVIIKGILSGSAAAAGFAFAFMPIEERPLERWLTSFLKSIYRPTQFLWKKNAPPPEILITDPIRPILTNSATVLKKEQTAAKVEEYLASLKPQTQVANDLDKKEDLFLNQTLAAFQTPVVPPIVRHAESAGWPSLASAPIKEPILKQAMPAGRQVQNDVVAPTIPTPDPLIIEAAPPSPPPSEENLLEQKIKNVVSQLETWEKKLNDQSLSKSEFIEIQAQMAYLLKEKERLTRELVKLRKFKMQKMSINNRLKDLEEKSNYAFRPPAGKTQMFPRDTTFPNTPSGVVKTQTGNLLPGILVEIRNPEGLPVRALKTGALGQFTVTTSLPNGQYTIYLEDPQKSYYFDLVALSVTGKVIPPLEIFAKTKRDQEREELSKKIFNTKNF